MAPGIEMKASLASLGTYIPIAIVVELSLPSLDLLMEHSQPSPLLAITQGSHRPKQLLLFFFLPFVL